MDCFETLVHKRGDPLPLCYPYPPLTRNIYSGCILYSIVWFGLNCSYLKVKGHKKDFCITKTTGWGD